MKMCIRRIVRAVGVTVPALLTNHLPHNLADHFT
jgi:hypothetical protein